MNFGAKGKLLLQELKRSEWLPPFNEEQFRLVIEEINALSHEVHRRMGDMPEDELQEPAVQAGILIHYHSMLRNKRCLLAYLRHRILKVQQLRWERGSVIPPKAGEKLSPKEVEFFGAYDRLLGDHMKKLNLDLTAFMEPPKRPYVEIVALKDCGDIFTERGVITLTKGSTHFVRLSEVEHLIRQRLVEPTHPM